jgi:hypothetical protein
MTMCHDGELPLVDAAAEVRPPYHTGSSSSHGATVVAMDRRKPPRGEALQPLTKDRLIERSLELSPTAYLTIVSIVQGVALAVLTQRTHDQIVQSKMPIVTVLLQGLALLLILVFVFHFYSATSILFRWTPSFMDALIPFIIGPFEIVPAFYVGQALPWSIAVAAFWGIAILGLGVTALYSPIGHFGEMTKPESADRARRAKRLFDRVLVEACGLAAITILLVLFFGFFANRYIEDDGTWAGFAAGASIAGLVAMVVDMERRLVRIYGVYGLKRSMFS